MSNLAGGGKDQDWEGTSGAGHVFASAKEAEVCDVSSADFTVTINNGTSMAILLGSDGNVNLRLVGETTDIVLPLKAGWHPIAATHIRTASTTVTAKATDIVVVAW